MELGLLGVYFAVEDMEHIEIQDWLRSNEGTPFMRRMTERFFNIDQFKQFNDRFGLVDRLLSSYSELGGFIHTRGYLYSPMKHSGSNVNRFQPTALEMYFESMTRVVTDIITVMLIKYPIGMIPLHLDQKFGFNGPAGGLLNAGQQEAVIEILEPEEREYLEKVAADDPDVQGIVEQIDAMPDVTQEQLDEQWARHEELMKSMNNDLQREEGDSSE